MEKIDIYRIDGHSLKIFLKVVETSSVTKTAEYFGLNQSTISHTLEKVRDSCDQNLFEKAGRGIIPTYAALDLVPLAKDVLMNLEAMTLRNAFDPLTDKRPISIAANVCELLPELKAIHSKIRAHLPDHHIRFIELGSRENLESNLESNIADLVVSVRSVSLSPVLEAAELLKDPIKIFYDPDMRGPITSIEEYFAAQHIMLDFGSNQKSTVTQIVEKMGRERNIVMGVANVYALGEMIKGSRMIASMQQRLANSTMSGLAHCDPPFETPSVHFDLIWHRRHAHAPRNMWLRNLILAERGQFAAN